MTTTEIELIDHTNGKLDEIKAFASKHPQGHTFQQCLDQLTRIAKNSGDHYGKKVLLFTDWAAYSLSFTFKHPDKDKPTLVGGIIYHGLVDDIHPETYSVTLGEADGWQVHT